jgi:hypothetical protein
MIGTKNKTSVATISFILTEKVEMDKEQSDLQRTATGMNKHAPLYVGQFDCCYYLLLYHIVDFCVH